MTLSDFILQGHLLTASLSKSDLFRTAVQQLTRFQLTQCVARSICELSLLFVHRAACCCI